MAPKAKKTSYVLSFDAFHLTRWSGAMRLMGVSTTNIPAWESYSHGWICKFSNFSHFQVSILYFVLMWFWPCKWLGFAMGWVKMKTWHIRRGRNMSKIDFGWCILENVEELLLSMFLCAWARACVCNLHSCVRSSVLAYVGMFLWFYVCKDGPAYIWSCLCMRALTHVCETLGRSPTLPISLLFQPFHFHM